MNPTSPAQEAAGTPARKPSGRHKPSFKTLWSAFARYSAGTYKRGAVLIALLFIAIGFLLVFVQVDHINARARRDDRFKQDEALYQAKLVTYGTAVGAYTVCLQGINRADLNRGQWEAAVEIIRATGGNVFADQLADGPLLASNAPTTADCPAPPPLPAPPKRP